MVFCFWPKEESLRLNGWSYSCNSCQSQLLQLDDVIQMTSFAWRKVYGIKIHDLTKDGEINFMRFFWYHSWSHCKMCWNCFSFCRSCLQLPLELFQLMQSRFWCFRLSFLSWKNYMFSPYIILVSNRLVDWYLMKF